MDQNSIMAISAIGVLLSFWILFSIIQSATKSTQIEKLLKMQNELLKSIAKNQGIDQQTIEVIETQNS
jgi:septum formation topological specificity factor MinE